MKQSNTPADGQTPGTVWMSEAVLEHFDDDVIFSSPKALAAVGMPTVRGKGALRDYWMMALFSP